MVQILGMISLTSFQDGREATFYIDSLDVLEPEFILFRLEWWSLSFTPTGWVGRTGLVEVFVEIKFFIPPLMDDFIIGGLRHSKIISSCHLENLKVPLIKNFF